MFKTIAMLFLLFLQLTSFIAFAQELYSRHPAYPPHTPAPLHPPANAPHHHNPSPSPPPFPHTSLHPPTKSSVHTPLHHHPTKPPTHHHPPAHALVNPLVVPTHPPLQAIVPAKPPTPDHHHHRHHPPAHARVRSPVVPTHPQLHPTPCPRSFNVVQGVVHVKSCEYDGLNSLLGATKLLGVVVELQYNNTMHKFQKVKTHMSFMVASLRKRSSCKFPRSSWWYHCCS